LFAVRHHVETGTFLLEEGDAHGIPLLYDLDDDLLNIPKDHPEADALRPRARIVAAMFAIVAPALRRLVETFGPRVSVDVIGMTGAELPPGVNRVGVPHDRGQTYPGFVSWIASQPAWHIGATPLANTAFNACKSSIKTLDYAALGLAVAASDVGVYRGSPAAGGGGALVPNTPGDWYAALSRLVRDPALVWRMAEAARAALADATLAAQAAQRRHAWNRLLGPQAAAPPAEHATAEQASAELRRSRARA